MAGPRSFPRSTSDDNASFKSVLFPATNAPGASFTLASAKRLRRSSTASSRLPWLSASRSTSIPRTWSWGHDYERLSEVEFQGKYGTPARKSRGAAPKTTCGSSAKAAWSCTARSLSDRSVHYGSGSSRCVLVEHGDHRKKGNEQKRFLAPRTFSSLRVCFGAG